ncbi:MAG: redoxin domain-containing protein, partial [Bacteroidia bacterium]|nr:redoxin domain-containing protein [Bacteroidia bacterium]
KNNYWKNIPLENESMLHTPIFAEKLKNYFDKIVFQIPDSINLEIAKIYSRIYSAKNSYMWSMSWLTQFYEKKGQQYMGFESVFVAIVDSFYETGKVDFYNAKQLEKIITRKNVLKPLLIGKTVPDLFTVDTNGMKVCLRLKMDTCRTSGCLTKIYETNRIELSRQLISIKDVKAEYTVLVFWDIDCGHCKKDIPVLFEKFKELREKDSIDVKVAAVYDQSDFVKWPKTIKEMQLLDPNWTNLADGVHLQNFKDKFDVYSNPVIYILDKNKVIRYKRIGAEQVGDAIRNMARG